jgi:small subunit ribosomal protein S16
MGRKHRPFYRLSAIDARRARDSRMVEELGYYDPGAKDPGKQLNLQRERIEYWLKMGAQPSDTVRDLLKRSGISLKA